MSASLKTKIITTIILCILSPIWVYANKATSSASATKNQQNKLADEMDNGITKELTTSNSTTTSDSSTAPIPTKTQVSLPNPAHQIVVIIDPGHGGKDSGAVGKCKTKEKTVVLAIAKSLQQELNQQPNIKAILTRNSDYFIPLRQRLKIARKFHGDLFISIHADAYMDNDARGASVYALSFRGATSEAARFLAQKENESELGQVIANKNPMLQSVLVDLTQTASISTSLDIGYMLINELSKFTALHHNDVEQAAFVVLKAPDIPSLLIETGFISNTAEEMKLRDKQYQQRIAMVLSSGIENYFAKHPASF